MNSLLFKNAQIITTTGIAKGELLVENGKISRLSFDKPIVAKATTEIDVQGNYLSPGFIDVHTHGAGNHDFMDGSLEAIYEACKMHMNHGTTSIIPTTLTSTKESLFEFIELFNQVELEKEALPHILGLHLEGPYFSYDQRGAQDPTYLRNPDPDEYEGVISRTNRVKRWSFAVELEGSHEFLQRLNEEGIVSSVAHSDASAEQVFRAYESGVTALTHFYSGMSGVTRHKGFRVAGVIEAGYLLDDMYVEVIADGKHLPKELLQLIYKVKGADKVVLVTDSMRGAGMPEGNYVLGNKETGTNVVVQDGVAKLLDYTAFAGSVATADRLVRTMHSLTTAPLYEVVKMMTYNPAKLLKMEDTIGSIALGKQADLVVFDQEVNVKTVVVGGNITKNLL